MFRRPPCDDTPDDADDEARAVEEEEEEEEANPDVVAPSFLFRSLDEEEEALTWCGIHQHVAILSLALFAGTYRIYDSFHSQESVVSTTPNPTPCTSLLPPTFACCLIRLISYGGRVG